MFNMFKKQGTSKRSASTSSIGDREQGLGLASPTGEQAIAGDMAIAGACEELEDALLATCCGGLRTRVYLDPGGVNPEDYGGDLENDPSLEYEFGQFVRKTVSNLFLPEEERFR